MRVYYLDSFVDDDGGSHKRTPHTIEYLTEDSYRIYIEETETNASGDVVTRWEETTITITEDESGTKGLYDSTTDIYYDNKQSWQSATFSLNWYIVLAQ